MVNRPRQRRYASKGRGGCRTCSSRHVRCDGKQPTCDSCRKSHRPCEWTTEDTSTPGLKIVLYSGEPKASIPRQPTNTVDATSRRPTRYFLDVVVPRLGGAFDPTCWAQIICQVAQHVSPIRNTVIAISSLWEATLSDKAQLAGIDNDKQIVALRKYATAVSEARKLSQTDQKSCIRELLICSLLFVLFENLSKHHESALSQASSGLSLFWTWQSSVTMKGRVNEADLDEISLQLIIRYRRLTTQALGFFDTHHIDKRKFANTPQTLMPIIPETFSSVEQIRDCFHWITNTHMYQGICMEQRHFGNDETPAYAALQLHRPWLSKFDRSFGAFKAGVMELEEKQQQAFASLEMFYTISTILYAVGPTGSEIGFDAYHDEFDEVVTLAEMLFSKRMLGYEHYMNVEALPPLYFLARSCREPNLRRRAISLLRDWDRQEGFWNSEMLAALAERMMILEETGLEPVLAAQQIPESRRLTMKWAVIHSSSRSIEAGFIRGASLSGGGTPICCTIRY